MNIERVLDALSEILSDKYGANIKLRVKQTQECEIDHRREGTA